MRGIAAVAVVLAITQPGLAAGVMCISSVSGGFERSGDGWQPVTAGQDMFLVTLIDQGDETAGLCYRLLQSEGASLEPKSGMSWACFARHQFDQAPTMLDISRCMVLWNGDSPGSLSCTGFRLSNLFFEPGGEYMETPSEVARLHAKDRDGNLLLSLGTCSEWIE